MIIEFGKDAEFVTLYFDIKHGETMHLSTLAKAMLEFEKVAIGVASISDPLLSFELTIDRTEAGSLRLLTRLRSALDPSRLKKLAQQIIIAMFALPSTLYIQEGVIKPYLIQYGLIEDGMTDEEIDRIAAEVVTAMRASDARDARNSFYQALEADDAVEGVGALPDHNPVPPRHIVQRKQFSGMVIRGEGSIEEVQLPRNVPVPAILIIERAVLRRGSKASWTFRFNGQAITARIDDIEFIDNLLSGKITLPLVEGVELDVILVSNQTFENGVWVHHGYSVKKVHAWRSPDQTSFVFSDGG